MAEKDYFTFTYCTMRRTFNLDGSQLAINCVRIARPLLTLISWFFCLFTGSSFFISIFSPTLNLDTLRMFQIENCIFFLALFYYSKITFSSSIKSSLANLFLIFFFRGREDKLYHHVTVVVDLCLCFFLFSFASYTSKQSVIAVSVLSLFFRYLFQRFCFSFIPQQSIQFLMKLTVFFFLLTKGILL